MNSHPQFDEDLELYELGVLDGSENAEVESHLAGCPQCRAKLAAARSRLALLALAAPESVPTPAARERILESFRAHGPRRREKTPAAPARRGFWTPAWTWVLAGFCVVLLGTSGWLARDNHRLSQRVAELELTGKELEASSQELKAEAGRAQAVLDVLTGPQTVQVELSPATAQPVPHGKAFYNRTRGLLFYTANLKPLPSNRTYELWLIPTEGKPVDVGIFNTDNQGNGQVILPAIPQGLTAKAFAVTVETAGGVPAPTGPMVLVGPVS
jgi:anti-sigma-K factor RskA